MPALGHTEKTEDRENVRPARVGEFGDCPREPSWKALDCGLRIALQGNEVLRVNERKRFGQIWEETGA